jgi:Group II intron, maturase-specific domain.
MISSSPPTHGGIGADRITAYQRLSGRTRCTALPYQNGDHTAFRRLRFSGAQIRKPQRRNGQPAKLPITPSKLSLHAVKAKIRALCKQAKGATPGQLIDKLNPVLRGWANYHRPVICSKTFRQLDSFVWRRLCRWAKLRHPNKTGRWIAQRYFPHLPRIYFGRCGVRLALDRVVISNGQR